MLERARENKAYIPVFRTEIFYGGGGGNIHVYVTQVYRGCLGFLYKVQEPECTLNLYHTLFTTSNHYFNPIHGEGGISPFLTLPLYETMHANMLHDDSS